jgi:hypothetical protein
MSARNTQFVPVQGHHGDLTPQEQETLRAVMLLRHQVNTLHHTSCCAWQMP